MRFRWLVLFSSWLCIQTGAAQEMRTWTSASGKTMEGALVEQQFGTVVLQTPQGEKMKIRLEQLSSGDQIYVGSQIKPAGTAAPVSAPGNDSEPAIPPALEALFGTRLVNAKGKRFSTTELAGKKIGIYFSASWCPPCRAFTPLLVAAYRQLQVENKPFEVVLVCHDRDEAAMKNYMKGHEMPWLAVPFGTKQVAALQKKFGVSGIPMLVIVDANGNTLSTKARGEVTAAGAKAFDHW